ncbi:MAG: hypothetical protein QOG46_2840, partial [Pseudonocardiales bacterium]|nr:hypothetical protein [Pseudonocardiales bacterium]
GELPSNKHIVLTSWGRTDRCGSVTDTDVKKFYADHVNTLAPEVGSGPGPENCAANLLPSTPPCTVGSTTPSASTSPTTSTKPTPSPSQSKQ